VNSPSTATDGSYPLSATVTESVSNGSATTSASYIVYRDSTAPTVTITSPLHGSILPRGSITVNATATDSSGVASVSFYVGNTLIGTDTSTPYSVRWNARKAAVGTYTLSATARDAAGNVSAPVSVTVTLR
jgi:hypothetical protein